MEIGSSPQPLTSLLPLYLILTLAYLLYSAKSLLTLMTNLDAANAAQAEAQQKRWLAK